MYKTISDVEKWVDKYRFWPFIASESIGLARFGILKTGTEKQSEMHEP
jgi:hypothetical protein